MDKLAQELLPFDNVEWDRQPDGFASLSRAQLMVSDISGVIFDFAFVFLRPVISVGAGPLKDGFEAWEIPHEAWEVSALDTLGKRILPGDEKNVVEAVQALLADDSRAREKNSRLARRKRCQFRCGRHADCACSGRRSRTPQESIDAQNAGKEGTVSDVGFHLHAFDCAA